MPRRGPRSTSTSPAPTPTHVAPSAEESGLPLSRRRQLATAAAVLLGGMLWALAGNDMPLWRWVVVLAAVGVALVPPVNRAIAALLARLRQPSPRALDWTGLLVGALAVAYLTTTALLQNRPLAPRMLDECSYAISAQMLARGKLWMAQHELADFFESFFLFVKPVYSSIYFPGTGLAFAPAVWLGWATWILPVVFAGVIVGLLFRIITTLTGDGAAGLLAAVWALSLMAFRALSVMVMSHLVMLLLGVLIVWAWLRWRDASSRQWPWALLIGALCGWAAITRPVDALAYAIPVGVAMALALRGQPARKWATTAGALVIGATPLLALQVVHNIGVTGSPLRTPYTAYLEQEQPGTQFGVRRYDPSLQPASQLPQMKSYYDWCRPYLENHQPHNFLVPWFSSHTHGRTGGQPARLLTLADNTLPARPLLLLLPAGVVALAGDRRRWVLAAALPLFVVLYVHNPFFLPHYSIVILPAMILLVMLGAAAVARSMRVRAVIVTAVFAISVTSLWEVRWALSGHRPPSDGFQELAARSMLYGTIDLLAQRPAVVLFGTPPDHWAEMVYDIDAAWPDDAPIVFARDLGARNVEIIDYYGRRQPERTFYQFDWQRGSLLTLGQAGELRERLGEARSAPRGEGVIR